MNYLDQKQLDDTLAGNKAYVEFLGQIRQEVDEYFADFSDSPEKMSRWGHHYFCRDEGGLLIFDINKPESHVCSICGKPWSDDLLNGVWFTMYRNYGVTSVWKSALVYRATGDDKYLNHLIGFTRFYNENYSSFRLHNKEGLESDNLEGAPWGSSRIMPQSLNESIFLIRLINALELVKKSLPEGFKAELEEGMLGEAFRLFAPQVEKIHNISTWLDCGIGVMGLFLGNREMIDFAFDGEFGADNQLRKGLTGDSFWYEGSIHYNHFLLEGVVNLLLFSEIYGKDFPVGKDAVNRMIKAAYSYAFDNHRLPNPNDGWPDLNLKTYSYIYAAAVKVLGEESESAQLLGSVLNREGERMTLPLSRPYYFNNDVSLEEFIFVPGLRGRYQNVLSSGSRNFADSYCALLKNDSTNVFLKYGHNGPSHAHPDKMNIEVLINDLIVSRDLSNAGYGNSLCNEWHRVTASHNTVVVNGESHSGFGGGECLTEEDGFLSVAAEEVYPGVKFYRDLNLGKAGFVDEFHVEAEISSTFDYFFHVDGDLVSELNTSAAELGFSKNGYQHIRNVKQAAAPAGVVEISWVVSGREITSRIETQGAELFLIESPDNPVTHYRPGIVLRKKGTDCRFRVSWEMKT